MPAEPSSEAGDGSGDRSSRRTLRFDAAEAPTARASATLQVPRTRTLRDELGRLIRRYITHADRGRTDEAAFRAWTAERTLPMVRVLGVVFVALILLSWPGDLRFRGEHQDVFDAFVIWRVAAIALISPLIIANRLPLIRRHPIHAATVVYIAFVGTLAYCLGRIGSLDSPWFYATYGSAWLIVIFPFGPLERLIWSFLTAVVAVAAYFLPFPEHFAHPYVAVVLINLASFTLVGVLIGHIVHHLVRENFFARREVEIERARADQLLHNILPDRVAARLKRAAAPIGERFDEVTVMFADIVEFTRLAGRIPPERLLRFLNDLFTRFDLIAERRGLEKIKTIGDSYVVAGGLPDPRADHAEAIADMALELMQTAAELRDPDGRPVGLRIGIQTGPVVAGVIGVKKLTYDLWGDTVNTASRLESQGIPGRIQIGDATRMRLEHAFVFEARGIVELKGKGEIPVWFLIGRQSR
jgi:class 3 adenylate cyclase